MRAVRGAAGFDGTAQTLQSVEHHFGVPGGAGGEENPLRPTISSPIATRTNNRWTARDAQPTDRINRSHHLAIGNNRLYRHRSDHESHVLHRQIGGAEDNTACDAIPFKERQRGGEVIVSRDQYRLSAKFLRTSTDTCTVQQIA